MAFFSFFTKRSDVPSKRLRFLARSFQVFGVVVGLSTVMLVYSIFSNPKLHTTFPPSFKWKFLTTGLAQTVSLFMIGRALLRRDRWGVYVGGLVLTVPIAVQLVFMKSMRGVPVTLGVSLVGLGLMASVWRELSPVGDSEVQVAEEPPVPLTPRNRGYGEPRSLPVGSVHLSVNAPLETAPIKADLPMESVHLSGIQQGIVPFAAELPADSLRAANTVGSAAPRKPSNSNAK